MSRQRPPEPVSWGRPDPASASGVQPSSKRGGTFFLGKYRVISEIGRGGMASVHLARIDGPGGFHRWVAIKRIHPNLVENDQYVDMFLDEARVAAGINHANVCQVFDLGREDDGYWIAMEYLHGEPLREMTRIFEERKTPMPAHLAARIVADAAEGLHAAHEVRGKNGQLLGLVHRDVTPHNIFVTYDGCTKVVDFGIAYMTERLCSPTNYGQLKGKLAYMAPEQLRNEELDRSADIFALGIVLWELTTNRRLFRRETDLDTLERVQKCEVPRPSSLVRGYPPGLEAVVMKALARDKSDRYATARELSRALSQFLIGQQALVGPEEIGNLVTGLFHDRIARREEHLAWAAEVTATGEGLPAPIFDPPSIQTGGPSVESGSSGKAEPTASEHDLDALPVVTGLAQADLCDEEDLPTIALPLDRVSSPPPPVSGARPLHDARRASHPSTPDASSEMAGPSDRTIRFSMAASASRYPTGEASRPSISTSIAAPGRRFSPVLVALFLATTLTVVGFAALVHTVWVYFAR